MDTVSARVAFFFLPNIDCGWNERIIDFEKRDRACLLFVDSLAMVLKSPSSRLLNGTLYYFREVDDELLWCGRGVLEYFVAMNWMRWRRQSNKVRAFLENQQGDPDNKYFRLSLERIP